MIDSFSVCGEQSFAFNGSDCDQLNATLKQLNPAFSLAHAAAGNLVFGARAMRVGRVTSVSGSCSGDISVFHGGETPAAVVLLPVSGLTGIAFAEHNLKCQNNCGAIIDGTIRHHAHLWGAAANNIMLIPHDELTKRLSLRLERSIRGPIDFELQLDLNEGAGLIFKQISAMLHSTSVNLAFDRAPLAATNLTETILELLIGAISHRYSTELLQSKHTAAPRHVKRAVEYMMANIAEPITLDDLAKHSGVSTRALQKGFQEFRMTSPTGYLRDLRLQCVHDELVESNVATQIKEVALKWGFIHMGRFAADYRKRFGIQPSETHRR